eukprot:CAMPEP_0202859456 /NCGR_PEP_ID=MMETSP1391-20130828/1559_1 /ASSEMBLY_ACC=CAM_ASM_000867 /TAXON_ID=1034604 /ORGANISM="Chlamydomonas leiostraca, Strain SAG 11-49" /LENGTH=125 /DNA_ID=CAMNT_0049538489 /DNA_START=338 /DNA_END=711 /DNA_ORIENTATION=-
MAAWSPRRLQLRLAWWTKRWVISLLHARRHDSIRQHSHPKPTDHRLLVLDEANVSGVLAEALTADVQAILADDGVPVAAHTALTGARPVVLGVGVPHSVVAHCDRLQANLRANRWQCVEKQGIKT